MGHVIIHTHPLKAILGLNAKILQKSPSLLDYILACDFQKTENGGIKKNLVIDPAGIWLYSINPKNCDDPDTFNKLLAAEFCETIQNGMLSVPEINAMLNDPTWDWGDQSPTKILGYLNSELGNFTGSASYTNSQLQSCQDNLRRESGVMLKQMTNIEYCNYRRQTESYPNTNNGNDNT